MTIHLVRHGESTSNADANARSENPGSSRLTEQGWLQAFALPQRLSRPERLVVSGFTRSQQTAEPLAKAWGLAPVEWDVHEWTCLEATKIVGSNHAERAVKISEYLGRWDPHHKEGPNAESFIEFVARVDAFRNRLSPYDTSTMVISHGWFIKATMWRGGYLGPADKEAMRSFWAFASGFSIPNCQGVVLDVARLGEG